MPAHRRALVTIAVVAALATGPHAPARAAGDGLPGVPTLVLWAWERPEDLRGLPQRTGVAFLAATYQLERETIVRRPRHQPLKVDPGTPLVAVVRIETNTADRPVFTGALATELAAEIAELRNQPGVRALQIDFDALLSERAFYRDLLTRLRAQVGDFPLSITALASWCMDDNWLQDLPIDEAVPMLFRLGPVNVPFAEAGAANRWRSPSCSAAVGISTDEPTRLQRGRRRVYVFHPRSWTSDAVARATEGFAR